GDGEAGEEQGDRTEGEEHGVDEVVADAALPAGGDRSEDRLDEALVARALDGRVAPLDEVGLAGGEAAEQGGRQGEGGQAGEQLEPGAERTALREVTQAVVHFVMYTAIQMTAKIATMTYQ